jgi:3',5'-cyclic AMP phosphodiesterase CpdA
MTASLLPNALDRRSFLRATAGLAAGLALPSVAAAKHDKKRVLRVAHLTDTHIQPELRAGEGVAACLSHVNGLKDKPELILTGGDHIMDAFAHKRDRTTLQWDLWKKTLQAGNSIPTTGCIGNHDIWGWSKKKSETTGDERDYGKKWAVEALGISNRFYSFDKAGWRFIALDSIQPGAKEGTYSAYLDEEQSAWLKKELAAATTPVLIWSHAPIVSAMPLLRKRQLATGDVSVSSGSCHTDAGELVDLFAKHPNVKACLSGHLHQVDHVRIKGVNFHCNGAVSGNWWRGKHDGFDEGYTIVDLFDDGSYTSEYVAYGWKAEPAPTRG